MIKILDLIYETIDAETLSHLKTLQAEKKRLDNIVDTAPAKQAMGVMSHLQYVNREIKKIKLEVAIDKLESKRRLVRSNQEWDKYTKKIDKYFDLLLKLRKEV